jgi:hypothetical protein
MNPVEEVQEGKHFTSFDEKDRDKLITDNFGELSDFIVDWDMEHEFLSESVKYKTEILGFEELSYEVDNYQNVSANNCDIVSDIMETINKLLEVEKENEEIVSMLQEAKASYQAVRNIAEDTTFNLEIYNREVVVEEEIIYDEVSRLTVEEAKERMDFLKKNIRCRDAIGVIRKIEFNNLYSDEFNAEDLDYVLETFLEEKKEDLDKFVNYVNRKINEIIASIRHTVNYVGSYEHITDYLKENENVVFDEDGDCVFI